MKAILSVSVFCLILLSCKNSVFEVSPSEVVIMNNVASYFGGKVAVNKTVFVTSSGDNSENKYKISLECDDLKKAYPSEYLPASYCAWSFYSQLSDSERQHFSQYIIQVPFENKQKIVEFSSEDLETVLQAKPQLDSVVAYFVRGDYQAMQGQFLPEVPRDSSLAQFQREIEKADHKFGMTQEMKIRSFEILDYEHDSIQEKLVRFRVLQIRDKAKLKFLVTVAPNTLYGCIAGLRFE